MTQEQYQIFDVEPKSSHHKEGMRYALSIHGYITFFTPDALIEFRDYVNEFVVKRVKK